jgi:hypothetical protein
LAQAQAQVPVQMQMQMQMQEAPPEPWPPAPVVEPADTTVPRLRSQAERDLLHALRLVR